MVVSRVDVAAAESVDRAAQRNLFRLRAYFVDLAREK